MIKKLVVCLLVLVCALMPTMASAAVVWDSYSDEARTVQSDMFGQHGIPVYMKATGLPQDKYYEVRYYDGDMVLILAEQVMSLNGKLLSSILPSGFKDSAVAGTWTAELYDLAPKVRLMATDTFTVEESAIPEFPTVASGIGITVVCGGVFVWMRKKRNKV